MNASTKEIGECATALAALVTALHKLIDDHPELRESLLPATIQLGEALPGLSSVLNVNIAKLDARLSTVEATLQKVVQEVAQLKADVAQLKGDVAQLKADVAELRQELAVFKAMMEERSKTFATKEDLHQLTWKMYGAMAGTMTGLTAGVYFIARYVH